VEYEIGIAAIARALASPARVEMVLVLLDGRAHPASILAREAGVALSTASAHLSILVETRLVSVEQTGRQRRYRLRGPLVVEAVEAMAALAPPPSGPLTGHSEAALLRSGRTCYDHLAGEIGMAITDALIAADAVVLSDRAFSLTPTGSKLMQQLGVDLQTARSARRGFGVACLDWTERRRHLGGSLGATLCTRFFEAGWVRRIGKGRAVELTKPGAKALSDLLGGRTDGGLPN
jgi:DNA-binding transcriptional ArsR family regulator